MKIIIDTDPGVDDAIALGMALSRADVEILAITCVPGNVDVDKATRNTLKIAQVYARRDIPVYKGTRSFIVGSPAHARDYHGTDGLGNVSDYDPDLSQLQTEHAVDAINRLVAANEGQVTLVALGPLTNLAMAYRLNDKLPGQLKELVIMGGNYKGVGNIAMGAEFNFYCDPVAAQIVLSGFECPIILVTFELSKFTVALSEQDIIEYTSQNNKKSEFKKKILEGHMALHKREALETRFCDAVAMAVALNREVLTKAHHVHGFVDTQGELTKGTCVYDWEGGGGKRRNVLVVDEVNEVLYRRLVLESVK